MSPTGQRGRAWRHSVAVRLLILLSVALLPLGLIAVLQTYSVLRDARQLAEKEILASTATAANRETALIMRAQGAGHALGAVIGADPDNIEACRDTLAEFVETNLEFVFAGFLPLDGVMRCSSGDGIVDFSDYPGWADFIATPKPTAEINRSGAVSGQPVLIATVPVYDTASELIGAMSVSIPHALADTLLDRNIEGVELALLNGDGDVLSTSGGPGVVPRFEHFGLVPERMDQTGLGATRVLPNIDGDMRTVAVVPLLAGDLFIVGKWSSDALPFQLTPLGTTVPIFPFVMWLASLCVAYLAIDRLVLRHLKLLRRRMSYFSLEDQANSYARLDGAPEELDAIARSYNAMIDRVAIEHHELEDTLREKDILLKEVHHRVKNNLQLIASILSMQIRSIDAPDAQKVLRRVQDRVMSLATIHKSLYSGSQVETVRVDTLLSEIIAGIFNVGVSGQANVTTRLDLAPVELDPDQAVPLSLLVTEAVTNAAKYVGVPASGPATITVVLSEDTPGRIALSVTNSRGAPIQDTQVNDGSGLGSRLITAFVSQLGGDFDIQESDAAYVLNVTFRKLGSVPEAKAAE